MSLPTRNGSAINRVEAWAEKFSDQLDRIADNTGGDSPREQMRYIRGNLIVVAGTQDITGAPIGPPQGFAWLVQRIVASVDSAATAQCEFRAYLDEVTPMRLVESLHLGAGNDIALAGPTGGSIYVPFSSKLIPRFIQVNIGSNCAYNICVKEFGIDND